MLQFRVGIIALLILLLIICIWGIADTSRDLIETTDSNSKNNSISGNLNFVSSNLNYISSNLIKTQDTNWYPETKGDLTCRWTYYDVFYTMSSCTNSSSGYDLKENVTIYGKVVSWKHDSDLPSNCVISNVMQFPDQQLFFCHSSNASIDAELDRYWPLEQNFSCSIDIHCRWIQWFIPPRTEPPITTSSDNQEPKDTTSLIVLLVCLLLTSVFILCSIAYCAYKAHKEYTLDRQLRHQLLQSQPL